MTVKIAIPYQHDINFEMNNKAKEFNLLFYKSRNKLEDLIAFINEYPDTRINIQFPEGVHIPTLKTISNVSDNVYVRLKASDMMNMKEINKNKIKFFFDSDCPAYNYTVLDSFIKMGVSDVYIADDLCYNMSDVETYVHDKGIQLRLILNHIPSTAIDRGINQRSPVYMPKDMDKLDKYYDVFEFDCGEPYDWAKFDVLYRSWFENKYWHGEIYEINNDVDQKFHCDSLYPEFTDFKLNCGRRCNIRVTNHCKKCEQFIKLGETLKKKKIRFV